MRLFSLIRPANTLRAITQCASSGHFLPGKPISAREIDELIHYAIQAPSSLDLQHWRFIAVAQRLLKERLAVIAHNQHKIVDSLVTIIVLGDLKAHSNAKEVLERSMESCRVNQDEMRRLAVGQPPMQFTGSARTSAETMASIAGAMYADPPACRDEAIRSASLASMTLMLAAEVKRFACCPVIRFDHDALRREFEIPERYLPVMLVAIGRGGQGAWFRKPRLSPEDVLFYNTGRNLPL